MVFLYTLLRTSQFCRSLDDCILNSEHSSSRQVTSKNLPYDCRATGAEVKASRGDNREVLARRPGRRLDPFETRSRLVSASRVRANTGGPLPGPTVRTDRRSDPWWQVAGTQDVRFQAMMPDSLHWLGVTKIHRFISMSDMKYDAITSSVRGMRAWVFFRRFRPRSDADGRPRGAPSARERGRFVRSSARPGRLLRDDEGRNRVPALELVAFSWWLVCVGSGLSLHQYLRFPCLGTVLHHVIGAGLVLRNFGTLLTRFCLPATERCVKFALESVPPVVNRAS